jgi:hypothetical protein
MTGVAAQVEPETRTTDQGCSEAGCRHGRLGSAPSGAAVNALTVDLEDWYHVCGAGETVSPLQWDATRAV